MRQILTAASAALLLCAASNTFAASGFTLDFNGSGNTLAATGFGGVYNLDTSGFNVGGGSLTTSTLGGDSFGNYENDPDTGKNWFYNTVDVGAQTVATAKLTVSGLSTNFHGGGIWMGYDQDHYVRLGVFHNSFNTPGPVSVELLRENEDRWTGANPGNPGGDIVSNQVGLGATSLQPLTIQLRITRTGNTVQGEYSLDNGTTFLPVGGSVSGFALAGNTTGLSNTLESTDFKVGVYTAGDPSASFAFDSLTVVPEPATLGALAMGGMLLRRCRA